MDLRQLEMAVLAVPVHAADLEAIPLGTEEFVVACSKSHPLLRRRKTIAAAEIANHPLILFKEWNEVFPNATCIVALLDRLLHHADVTVIEGDSYRIRESEQETAARRRKK